MISISPVSSISLFKETRTDLEPLLPGSIIQIQVPSTSTFSVRSKPQRRILSTLPTYQDDDAFGKHCLASSSSLFFGISKRHPRTFLWRVLDDSKVLELRSADLSKSNQEAREASLIIQLCFPSALKHGGIALADNHDQDILYVFALTKGNELYTFTLRKDMFCHAAASEEDISRWSKVSKPATFSISTPHKLIAPNDLQLMISLSDGRLLILRREKEDDGSKWFELTYGDGQWTSSLRGLVRWQGSNTIKYDGTMLEQGTPIAMVVSPDCKHIFAVCLNHTLRIWSPNKAASLFSKDLLWRHREVYEIPKVMLDPGSPNVLQLFQSDGDIEGDSYYAVTFSPHDFGQFKFWAIRDADAGEKGVRDLFPDCLLKPPDPDPSPESQNLWKVADFKVKGALTGDSLEIWILMVSNRHYKLYNLKFNTSNLATVWQDEWSSMASETLKQRPQPQVSDLDPQDATEQWLDLILRPGKCPDSILETALSMYCSEHSILLPKDNRSLKERMCTAVALKVGSNESKGDFNQYRNTTEREWAILSDHILDLDKSRWVIRSLAYDERFQMPWIVFADACSTVRTCDKTEILIQNEPTVLSKSMSMLESPSVEMEPGSEPKLPDELACIIEAAATFRRRFSYGLQQTCASIISEELWLEPSHSVPLRIQSFYDRCNFAEEIGSVTFDELTNALEPVNGFNGLETDALYSILDELSYSLLPNPSGLLHTLFGQKALINGTRELIALREHMLLDLLTLAVFVDMEIDRDEMPMENFDAAPIYVKLLDLLKQYQLTRWLVENRRIEKIGGSAKSQSPSVQNGKTSGGNRGTETTILESIFAVDIPAQSLDTQSQPEALTYSIKDLLQSVIEGHGDRTLDDISVLVQTNLLANKNIDLASDFLRYQPSTAWSTYIKGRLYLAKGKFTEAAIYFKKAAFKLCKPPCSHTPGSD